MNRLVPINFLVKLGLLLSICMTLWWNLWKLLQEKLFCYPFREDNASLFNIAPFRHKAIHRHLKQRHWGIKHIFKLQIKSYKFEDLFIHLIGKPKQTVTDIELTLMTCDITSKVVKINAVTHRKSVQWFSRLLTPQIYLWTPCGVHSPPRLCTTHTVSVRLH